MTNIPANLPKELSAKQWRSNKGLFTKAVSDATGMGAALDKLGTAWSAVPWKTVDAQQALGQAAPTGDVTSDLLDKLEPLAKARHDQGEAVKRELRAVEALAQKTQTAWKGNKLVPASSLKYVGQVYSAAATLVQELDELDESWKAHRFTAEHGRMRRTDENIVATQVRGAVSSLRDAAQAADTKLTLTSYRKLAAALTEAIEALGKSSVPADQKLRTALMPVSKNWYNPKNSDEAESDAAVLRVTQVLNVMRNA